MSARGTNLVELRAFGLDVPVGGEFRPLIRDLSVEIAAGEAVGLVGESGAGKSMTARSIMRLLPRNARTHGELLFRGKSVGDFGTAALREFRATEVAMIYQDPRAHINPVRTIGDFLLEGPVRVQGRSRGEATEAAVGLMRSVGIADAPRRLRQYPHQLSGGLLQRIMIASALLAEPQLILADEPTTALDVTTQEEVMAILDEQRRDRDLAMLFITHDLDLAAAVTDRISVLYAGSLMESGPAEELHSVCLHPYTAGLVAARPSTSKVERLEAVPGRPIAAFETGTGCPFATRCPHAESRCRVEQPRPRELGGHLVACLRAEELMAAASETEVAPR